ncbi:pentapeptide repeat-containing protein [Spiroplasma citri]|uniref:pentapeptide repeat-containing protein n=1 Tax=Spiroplasma citri TaxID=2133 RepID=UPI002412C9EE|nr:pentapeptide repeat-containing protein [Spiroplasma citri]WFH01126.1 pentapeptide repeat-containing protein [Spiroplasma citri]
MKTLQDLIKDLTDIIVEEQKINDYLEYEVLDLQGADLRGVNLSFADLCYSKLQDVDLRYADLKNIKITQQQLGQLTVIGEDK